MTTTVLLDRDTLDIGDLDCAALEQVGGDFRSYGQTAPEEVIERIGDAQIVITNKVVLSETVLKACPSIELICAIATGVNNIDVEAAKARGIRVVNCRGYGTESVSQLAITLMLALNTQLDNYVQAVRGGRWEQAPHFCFLDYPIREIAGQRLLVVGHGELGGAVAQKAQALGMDVEIAERPGAETIRAGRVDFASAIANADIVTLHCPLTDETRNLLNAKVFARMKPNALVINTARGGIVHEQDLVDALRNGQIGGAGMDVLTEEPPRNGNPLLAPDIPNLLLTPHCAWGSRTARQRIVAQTVENIGAWQAGEPIRVVV